jgi:tetratricopeptide (TPR) repeat protein
MRILVLPLMFAALICLCSCSDTYNEPVYLSNQEGLSDVYTDRPLYSSLYYEGTASNVGQNYHVFVLKIISKFHPVKAFNIYYLPLTEFTFRTTSAEYQGKDAMTFAYHFSYDHDAGIFKLSKGDSRQGEMVKANFTEKFTLREEKCITAKANALENPDSFPQVKYAAEICYLAGNFADSKIFTLQLDEHKDSFDDETQGGILHEYHTMIGRHMLRDGHPEEAKKHLLLSIDVEPTSVMKSFGPNMSLALDLLMEGEKETVITYLDGCTEFWKKEPVQLWKAKIRNNKMPSLNIHNWDQEKLGTYQVTDTTLTGPQVRRILSGNTVTGYYDHEGWDIRFHLYFAPDGKSIYGDHYGNKPTAWEIREDGCMLLDTRWNLYGGCLYFEQNRDSTLVLHPGVYAIDTRLLVLAGRHEYAESDCLRDFKSEQYELAFNSCLTAAKSNDMQAQNLLGVIYERHLGADTDYEKAIHWYESALEQGERFAPFNLAELYRTRKAGIRDEEKAVEYYTMSAERGYGEAQFSLGVMYFEGSGTAVDMEKARYWWERAKSNGVARAESALNRIP